MQETPIEIIEKQAAKLSLHEHIRLMEALTQQLRKKMFLPLQRHLLLSFRRTPDRSPGQAPESSQSDLGDGYFDSVVIGGLLDAGSSPA